MSVFVFLGPSLNLNEATKILPNAHYLPPVACGDIISILQLKPKIIVIIDGYFENRPAVWHKEILYAISKGIVVYGASSMGALRASELDIFGMIGIGEIYNRYHTATIIDDDEVALSHSHQIDNFKRYTIPMINIRITAELALKQCIIEQSWANKFLKIAKNIFYRERTYDALVDRCKHLDKIGEFMVWFKNNYIDQKMLDAKKVLKAVYNQKHHSVNTITCSNTSLLRNLKITKLSMPLPFFYKWLPVEHQIGILSKLFKDEYNISKSLAKTIGVAHDCGFIQIKNQQIIITNHATNTVLFARILNCLIKFSTSPLDTVKKNSFKIIAQIITTLYTTLKLHFETINATNLNEITRQFYSKHQINSKEEFAAWLQQNAMEIEDFNFAISIFYFFDYFIIKNNLSVLFKSTNSEIHNYFLIALSLNGLDKIIIKTLIHQKEILLKNNNLSLNLSGDAYSITQDFTDSFEMRDFIKKIANLELTYLESSSLKSWILQ